ncbi:MULTISPECIES: O-antigen ligase family protein [Tenacibaculum]|uniref:O-antigen ligase family protein n=1 Tax=Tenacibaculum TaxID=104267 RepID=UPI001F0B2A55|nr:MULTISPECIES: O-antigen ligase family protein [Tenacibaculum]MCH3881955.1 O-antigen ligase family protein [Tenacibaculum aquimarinum]MDO6600708.1 O-antigen ligase family protein [Tenacibaculum sp. 1_MG-2023]
MLLLIIHIAIGFLATFSLFSKLYNVLIIAVGFFVLLRTKNKNEEAFMLASYLVGAEVFLRMTGGSISYEIGKYGVALFLILGIIVGKEKKTAPVAYIFYIMLLFLGIILTEVPFGESVRKAIIFNLSGPILLGICTVYFYQKNISISTLLNALKYMTLPIISMVSFMYLRTPDLSELVFGTDANFYTSGGFGPNQVATILGLGIFIMTVFLFLKTKLTGYLYLDAIILVYFTYRGLLTFSRGGILTGVIAIILFLGFMFLYNNFTRKEVLKYSGLIFLFTIGIWIYTSGITGGMINNRYLGKNSIGMQKDITSGRGKILSLQLQNFYDSPIFGIGVGNGKYSREELDINIALASHNEVSRLLEEHGLIGIIILIILFVPPLTHIYQSNNFQRAFLLSFLAFWFLTISHSAMRVAFPSFIYALSLIVITDDDE